MNKKLIILLLLLLTNLGSYLYSMESAKTKSTQEKTFHKFQDLPAELRQHILTLAAQSDSIDKAVDNFLKYSHTVHHFFPDKEALSHAIGLLSQEYINQHKNTVAKEFFDAVRNDNIRAIKTLLLGGFDINSKEEQGNTPLIVAVIKNPFVSFIGGTKRKTLETINLLLQHNANINAQNNTGKTALMAAALFGRKAIVEALLKAGADINLKDKQGKTALDIVQQAPAADRSEIIELLRKHSAK